MLYILPIVVLCCSVASISPAIASSTTSDAVRADVLPAADARSGEMVGRFASHKDFDRLVLPGPDKATTVSRNGTSLTVKLPPSMTLKPIPRCGRRLVTVTGSSGLAVMSLVAGAEVHTWRKDGLLIIDVLDPVKTSGMASRPTQVAPAPTSSHNRSGVKPVDAVKTSSSIPSAETRPNLPTSPAGSNSSLHATKPSNAASPQPSSGSSSSGTGTFAPPNPAAVAFLDEAELPGPAILLPISGKIGAAAFSRGGEAHLVFDQPQALDLSPLKDNPIFGSMTETVLPGGTHLHLKLPSGAQLHLVQHSRNWAVSLSPLAFPSSAPPIIGHKRAGSLFFDVGSPGGVVVLDDSVSGGRLLVGTEHAEGRRVPSQHSGAELTVLPTWQGLVLVPASDRLVFRAVKDGFQVSILDAPTLSSLWPEQALGAWPDGRTMTRMFDFPSSSFSSQRRQLTQALQDAAGLPKAARYPARLRVAQAMLAEGLDVEAAAVVRAAVSDDPRHRADPKAAALAAMAAWLSAQAGGDEAPPAEAAPLDGSDEAALWRALLWPGRPDTARQAAALAATWPLMQAYPQNLRRFMLQPAAALLQVGGQDKAWAAFLQAFPDALLDLSRAQYLQSRGKTDESLALLDRVGQRPDRLARAEALALAVDERLKAGRITPAQAAERLERLLFSWRGDSRELALRQRLAQLQAQAGSWRKALTGLDEAGALFPNDQASIREAQANIISTLIHGDQAAKLNALELASLAESAAKLPSDLDQGRFAPMLADKLLALDLPEQAEPIIRNLFSRTKTVQSKAEVGLQLAGLQAGRGDASAALAVLDGSTDIGLAPPLAADRALMRGRLLASLGRPVDALAIMSNQPGAKARELEVTIMEAQHDWQGAARVLDRMTSEHEFTALPEVSKQDIVIHMARDRSEARDTVGLKQLRETYAARFRSGPNAALFAVLTAEPVHSAADLPRSANEIAAMHALPALLSPPAS